MQQVDWGTYDWRHRRRVRYAVTGFLCALGLVVALFASVVVLGAASAYGGTGAGLYQTQWVQSVGLRSEWRMLCETAPYGSACVQVTGLRSIPGTENLLLTYTSGENGSSPPTALGIAELNATTGVWTARVPLGCEPGEMFYPGTGTTVFVPCSAPETGANSSIVEFDYARAAVVGDLATPGFPEAVGYDPANGQVYVAFLNGSIVSISPATGAVVARTSVPPPGYGAGFGGAWNMLSWSLLYDPYSKLMLTQTGDPYVAALNPANLTVMAQIPTGSPAWAMTIDPVNRELYVATSDGTVLAFDPTSFNPMASIGLSSDGCGNGGAAFLADQMILDPAHGDLYLPGFYYCFGVVNTTGNYAVSTLPVGGNGQSWAAYVPTADAILFYYPIIIFAGPIVAGVLSHSEGRALTSVLGETPLLGESLLALAVWIPVALAAFLVVRRTLRREPQRPGVVGETGPLPNRKG